MIAASFNVHAQESCGNLKVYNVWVNCCFNFNLCVSFVLPYGQAATHTHRRKGCITAAYQSVGPLRCEFHIKTKQKWTLEVGIAESVWLFSLQVIHFIRISQRDLTRVPARRQVLVTMSTWCDCGSQNLSNLMPNSQLSAPSVPSTPSHVSPPKREDTLHSTYAPTRGASTSPH